MDSLSVNNSPAMGAVQASLAAAQTQSQTQIAVLKKAQEIQQQQGEAALSLIEAATENLVDLRA